MNIRPYREEDEPALFALLETEGEEWACYYVPSMRARYRKALLASLTYVADEGGMLCGYVRAIDDHGLYVYVCDLLVDKRFRGRQIGSRLMERICEDSTQPVYVMSDADGYYQRLGYRREGSVFLVAMPAV